MPVDPELTPETDEAVGAAASSNVGSVHSKSRPLLLGVAVAIVVVAAVGLVFARQPHDGTKRDQVTSVADFISVAVRKDSGDASSVRDYWSFAPKGAVPDSAVDLSVQRVASGAYGPPIHDTTIIGRQWKADTLVLTVKTKFLKNPSSETTTSEMWLSALEDRGRSMVRVHPEPALGSPDWYYEVRREGSRWIIVDRYSDVTGATDGLNSPLHIWDDFPKP